MFRIINKNKVFGNAFIVKAYSEESAIQIFESTNSKYIFEVKELMFGFWEIYAGKLEDQIPQENIE